MADALYAWSEIRVGDPASEGEPGNTNVIKPGDTVTQADTGLGDTEWNQLLESGAVRSMEYPAVPETYQGSPVDYLREQARQAADTALVEVQESETNISAIRAANEAATGQALQPETTDPEVLEEMNRQLADNVPAGEKPTSEATLASTQDVSNE